MLIEATRRVSRVAVERVRDAFIEFDKVAFKAVQVDLPAEITYQVIRDGRTYVLAVNDPTLEFADQEGNVYDCGD